MGDLCALGAALGWGTTAFMPRGSAMRQVLPEMQLFWMVLVSTVVLLAAAPFFGPLLRDLQPVHLVWLVVQIVVIVTGGFIVWLWLLSIYPSARVAGFSFLTSVFCVLFGWLLLGEVVEPSTLVAAGMVAIGIILINLPRRTVAPA